MRAAARTAEEEAGTNSGGGGCGGEGEGWVGWGRRWSGGEVGREREVEVGEVEGGRVGGGRVRARG